MASTHSRGHSDTGQGLSAVNLNEPVRRKLSVLPQEVPAKVRGRYICRGSGRLE
jgi:hypothetical protein